MKIEQATIDAISRKLEEQVAPLVRHPFSFDVQDDYEFLLVVAYAKPGTSPCQASEIVERMANVVAPAIPPKSGNHSWMVILQDDGVVRDVRQSEIL